jgi:predicted RNA methylase
VPLPHERRLADKTHAALAIQCDNRADQGREQAAQLASPRAKVEHAGVARKLELLSENGAQDVALVVLSSADLQVVPLALAAHGVDALVLRAKARRRDLAHPIWGAALQQAGARRQPCRRRYSDHVNGMILTRALRIHGALAMELVRPGSPQTSAYCFLVPGGFAELSVATLEREAGLCPPVASCAVPLHPVLPAGFAAGAAAGFSPILISSGAGPLPQSALRSPVISAALAHVGLLDVDVGQCSDDPSAAVAAVAAFLREARPAWMAALACWRYHTTQAAARNDGAPAGSASSRGTQCGRKSAATALSHTSAAAPPQAPLSFRVATVRGGKHTASSRAFAGALGDVVCSWHPDWTVNLSSPDLCLFCLIVQARILLGVVLPPSFSKPSEAMPQEPSRSLVAGLDRPHMRPSRAAALARLLAPSAGDVVLDPCGGIGTLAIAAASLAPVAALSVDLDPMACAAAAANARAARQAGELRGIVSVCCADASSSAWLRPSSVDGVLADLPYGHMHSRLDVGVLLRQLARLLRPGGRAVLLGGAGPSGTAAACLKSALCWPPGVWGVERQLPCQAGGIECIAVVLVRLHTAAHTGRTRPRNRGSPGAEAGGPCKEAAGVKHPLA